MKKIAKELRSKSKEELEKDVTTLRNDIAKLKIEVKVKPEKDSNILSKKKQRLAITLTMLKEKKLGISK